MGGETVKPSEIIGIVGLTLSVIVIPFFVVLWKTSARWTTMDMRMAQMNTELRALVNDKERAHSTLLDQITRDREATNMRLRYLEEHAWPIGRGRKDAA